MKASTYMTPYQRTARGPMLKRIGSNCGWTSKGYSFGGNSNGVRYSTGMKRLLRFAASFLLVLPLAAFAQAYPNKPLRIVVTYPPGGGADIMARLIAPKMAFPRAT